MNRSMLATLIATLVLGSSLVCGAQPMGQLLGESVTKSIPINWAQDGRVLTVQLKNQSDKWLLSQLTLYTVAPGETAKTACPKVTSQKPGDWADYLPGGPCGGVIPFGNRYVVETKIYPGQQSTLNVELETDRKLQSVSILESRGREPSLSDRIGRHF